MTPVCKAHRHSSPARAAKCWRKETRRRLARLPVPAVPQYVQVVYRPPVVRTLPTGVRVTWYAEGLDMGTNQTYIPPHDEAT